MMEDKKIIFNLETALGIALMALEQKLPLSAHIAANGPTVGEVIHRGLALAKVAQQNVQSDGAIGCAFCDYGTGQGACPECGTLLPPRR